MRVKALVQLVLFADRPLEKTFSAISSDGGGGGQLTRHCAEPGHRNAGGQMATGGIDGCGEPYSELVHHFCNKTAFQPDEIMILN